MWWIPEWNEVPEFAREEYFKDLVDDIGTAEVYKKTEVDETTQDALNTYFALDRLCDRRERFLWLWRRALLSAYPVYRDEMEMWKERKLYKWYYDNQKDNVKTHDGTFTLDEQTKAELIRAINSTLHEVSKSVTDTDRTGTANANSETNDESETTSNEKTKGKGKERNFSFQYPESNYSGGVVPYDLDNDPSVEFISAQADRLTQNESETNTTSNTRADGTTTSEQNDTEAIDSATDTSRDQTVGSNQTDNSTGERNQNTTTHWEETTAYKGDSLVDIAKELLAELPDTNFFERFVNKLKNCFQNDFLFDEIEEGL